MKRKVLSIVMVGLFCLPLVLTQCKTKEEAPPMRDTKEDYEDFREGVFEREFEEDYNL